MSALYMRIVKERKAQCATFAHFQIRDDAAMTRLPEDGVPDAIASCLQHVEGADRAPVHLEGPASKTAELGKEEDAGDESEESDSDHSTSVGGDTTRHTSKTRQPE